MWFGVEMNESFDLITLPWLVSRYKTSVNLYLPIFTGQSLPFCRYLIFGILAHLQLFASMTGFLTSAKDSTSAHF